MTLLVGLHVSENSTQRKFYPKKIPSEENSIKEKSTQGKFDQRKYHARKYYHWKIPPKENPEENFT